jgi:alanyl-tRNA synthetase
MQNHKPKFLNPDNTHHGSLQSCIRTNDLSLVGNGTHLTYFEMLGNFSFGCNDYESSVEMWTLILYDLNIKTTVHYHPKSNLKTLWTKRGFETVPDEECVWSDGNVGGYCCEHYVGDLEIGNLVNPLNHSTDVGFGWERMLMVLENKKRVDETSLFDSSLDPITKDHERTLNCLWQNNIQPGNKGRNYVCRRLLRRILSCDKKFIFQKWIEQERELRQKCIQKGKKLWKKHKDKPISFWWETCGIMEYDLTLIAN